MLKAVKLMAKTDAKTLWKFTWFMFVIAAFLVAIILAIKS